MSKIRFLGLDVRAATIAIAVAEPNGKVRSVGVIPNRGIDSQGQGQARSGEAVEACYEAGPTGYVLYWQLTQLGVSCEVIAPSLVPAKAGDRVKTDRRDAVALAPPCLPCCFLLHAPGNPLTSISRSRLLHLYMTLDKVAPYQKYRFRKT